MTKLTPNERIRAINATAIGRMNALVIAYVYAMSTFGKSLEEITFLKFVAPTPATRFGSTPGASLRTALISSLEKTF